MSMSMGFQSFKSFDVVEWRRMNNIWLRILKIEE